jgi:hypothetical protein
VIDVVNGGAAGVDVLVDGVEGLVNGVGDAVEWIVPGEFEIPDVDVPTIGRVPPFGGFHPDYTGITNPRPGSRPPRKPPATGVGHAPGSGNGTAPSDGDDPDGGNSPGGEGGPGGSGDPRAGDGNSKPPGPKSERVRPPKPHINRPPGWGVE